MRDRRLGVSGAEGAATALALHRQDRVEGGRLLAVADVEGTGVDAHAPDDDRSPAGTERGLVAVSAMTVADGDTRWNVAASRGSLLIYRGAVQVASSARGAPR